MSPRIPILMYHSVSHSAAPRFRRFVVPPDTFARQMEFLRQNDYRALTVSQFIAQREQLTSSARIVVLTFDDGFADFYADALPILQQFGFAATLYVTTQFVGATSRWLTREGEATRSLLTWEQLATLARAGIEIGAHSHSHAALDTLAPRAAQQEIARPKEILEQRLGVSVTSFAYPFGYYTRAVKKMVQAAGYTSACAVKYTASSLRDDPFALARLLVDATARADDFAALVRRAPMQTFLHTRSLLWRSVRALRAQKDTL